MSDEVQVQVNVPTQAKALADALVLLVSDLKAKKAVAAVAADVLPAVVSALSNLTELEAELKDQAIYTLAGLLAAQLVVALKAPAPAPAA